MDIPYVRGRVAAQAHVGLPEGTVEEEYARNGFFGRYAHLYRKNAPVGWISKELLKPNDWVVVPVRVRAPEKPSKNEASTGTAAEDKPAPKPRKKR